MPVWALERLPHYRAGIRASAVGTEVPKERRANPVPNLISRIRTSARDLRKGSPASRRERDIWVLSASNYRRKDDLGIYQCALAEHLRSQLGARLLFIERNQANLPTQDREDVLFVDAAFIGAEAVGRALGPLLAATPLGASARRPGSPARASLLCRDGLYARVMLALARRWIREARPRAVFVLNGYHLFIPFQLAVREAGIPLIELQHGIITESHAGYIYDRPPPVEHLPDHLVVYGRHFGELLDRESPRWRGRWSIGGHPWLRLKQSGLDKEPDSAFDTVALFSQDIPFVRERMRKLAPELRRKLDPRRRLVLKPHPGERDAASYYADAARAGVEIATPRDDSYSLLRRCRLAVSVYSTISLEALAFRSRSALLNSPVWPEDLRTLVEQGVISAAETADDLLPLAHLAPTPPRSDDLANRLFGVREPPLDFDALITEVESRRKAELEP